MLILSIDPGDSSGMAVKIGTVYKTFTAITHKEVLDFLASQPWNQVVLEYFIASGRISGYGVHTIELVGGIKALSSYLDIPWCAQAPHRRLPYNRKAYNILTGTRHTDHELSALAHLLAWEAYDDRKRTISK